MGTWFNGDNLYKKFGTTKATPANGGEYVTTGELREYVFQITLTDLTTTAAIVNDVNFFPTGVRIQEIEIETVTAATSSGSATLNIGLQRVDRSTEIDYDGFVAALALTAFDAAGETQTIRVGSTGAGALLGTATSQVGYVTADYDTAAFTAGVIRVRIKYFQHSTITQ